MCECKLLQHNLYKQARSIHASDREETTIIKSGFDAVNESWGTEKNSRYKN